MCTHSGHGNLISDPLYEINGVSCDYHCYAFIFIFVIEIFFENKKKNIQGEAFHHQSQLKGSHIQNGTYGTQNYQNYQTYETFELYEVKQETNGTKEVNPDDE